MATDPYVGSVFGRLTVLSTEMRKVPNGTCRWAWTVCVCGRMKWIRMYCLKNGKTVSCGCAHDRIRHGQKYGGKATEDYRRWQNAKNQGGVCSLWEDPCEFLAAIADMPGYGIPGARLIRIDQSQPWGPDNCKWKVSK